MASLKSSRFLFSSAKRWQFARTLFGSRGEPRKSQSKVLGESSSQIYELQVHDVKPKCMEDYLKSSAEHLVRISDSQDIPADLIGSWSVEVGPKLDQIVHLWRYKGGYGTLDKVWAALRNDQVYQDYFKNHVRSNVYSRSSQILVAFTFWDPEALVSKNKKGMYELRSYTLKSGTLIEWGQFWKVGIQYRGKDEAVGGWFSQIGDMHTAHHLWSYDNFINRQETRDSAWHVPGWDECVLNTVPLIRHMEANILLPTSFSPLQ